MNWKPTAIAGFSCLLVFVSATTQLAHAENIVFPSDCGYINVKQPPYNAAGDGVTDDTAAIQQAFNDVKSNRNMVYLPNGVYLVSDTIRWTLGAAGSSDDYKRQILQGQSRDGTIIRLKDHCSGFQNPTSRKSVIWTGNAPAQRFRNAIWNLTVHTGSGNYGACGIQFNASNQGTLRHVKIISGDGNGIYGLDFAFTDEIGPLLVYDLHVDGFSVGIKTAYSVNSQTLEKVTLENQFEYGIENVGQVFSIRNLTSLNTVPAIKNNGHMTLIDADLQGIGGASSLPAIDNAKTLYARDVTTAGYAKAVNNTGGNGEDVNGNTIAEFLSHDIQSQFPSPAASLHLPIEEIPEVPWEQDLGQWANVRHYGAIGDGKADDTAAIQAAIDSGKTTVYLPNGFYKFRLNSDVYLRANVRRFIGCEAKFVGSGNVVLKDGTHPVVVLERVENAYGNVGVRHDSSRTLVVNSFASPEDIISTGTGDFFLNDVVTSSLQLTNPAQNIWMRQIDIEGRDVVNILNSGATLWILGLKTEQNDCKIETVNGGRTEVLGGHVYAHVESGNIPLFRITEASASFAGIRQISFNGTWYDNIVEETRDGVTRLLTRTEAGNVLGLYTGYTLTELDPDINTSGYVDFSDFRLLAQRWLNCGCMAADWCGRTDLNLDGRVDADDLDRLTEKWLFGDVPD